MVVETVITLAVTTVEWEGYGPAALISTTSATLTGRSWLALARRFYENETEQCVCFRYHQQLANNNNKDEEEEEII